MTTIDIILRYLPAVVALAAGLLIPAVLVMRAGTK